MLNGYLFSYVDIWTAHFDIWYVLYKHVFSLYGHMNDLMLTIEYVNKTFIYLCDIWTAYIVDWLKIVYIDLENQ